jgi:ATP synthase protein I
VAQDPWGTKALGKALSLATNMAASLAVGFFLGDFLDKRFGTWPWLTLIFFLLGTATGLKMTYEAAFGKLETPEDVQKMMNVKDNLTKLKEVREDLKKDQDPKDF